MINLYVFNEFAAVNYCASLLRMVDTKVFAVLSVIVLDIKVWASSMANNLIDAFDWLKLLPEV